MPAPTCIHCGSPLLDQRAQQTGYCCAGCAYVHRLILEQGLGSYYELKDPVTPPADPSLFLPRDYSWLEEWKQELETGSAAKNRCEGLLAVQGVSCAGCVWLIEKLFHQEEGGLQALLNAQTGELRLAWIPGAFDLRAFAEKLHRFGYLLGPSSQVGVHLESRDLVRRIGLCSAFMMNVMLFTLPSYFGMQPSFTYARLFETLSLAFGTLSLLVGGSYFLGRAYQAARQGLLHLDLPIGLGIAFSYLGSLYGWLAERPDYLYFDFVSTFTLLMLTGRWAQVAAVERNQRRLLGLQVKSPRLRARLPEGTEREIAPEELQPGQSFRLGTGQTCPVDARLESGEAQASLASINGEAEPRLFRAGALLPAGALNVGRAELQLTAQQTWNESLLAKLTAEGERPGVRHRRIEAVVRGYLFGIFATALLSGAGWWLGTQDPLKTGAVVVAVLVVSCPCAIGLAVPLADEMAAVALRRKGVYVRENDLWARLGQVRRLVFDKTGTLTLETPELLNPETLAELAPESRAVVHTLVQASAHPLSQSLLAELLSSDTPPLLKGKVEEVLGQGLWLQEAGAEWRLGRETWALHRNEPQTAQRPPDQAPAWHQACVVLAREGQAFARFHFEDRPRADARQELALLSAQGYEIQILSGDHPAKVNRLAQHLGLPPERTLANQSPEAKAAWIASIDRKDTLMLGDGANDSLAFDRAYCRGTPVIHRGLLERKADFFYLGRGIGGLRALFEINALRNQTQILLICFSVAYNVVTVGLAVAGQMNPLVAAVLMPLNSLLSIALTLWRMRRAF